MGLGPCFVMVLTWVCKDSELGGHRIYLGSCAIRTLHSRIACIHIAQ